MTGKRNEQDNRRSPFPGRIEVASTTDRADRPTLGGPRVRGSWAGCPAAARGAEGFQGVDAPDLHGEMTVRLAGIGEKLIAVCI